MNLAELHLLAQDLWVIADMNLSDFYINPNVKICNSEIQERIFPSFLMHDRAISVSPRLINIGRWGRHLLLAFNTCTIVLKMSYKAKLIVTRNISHRDTIVSDRTRACILSLFSGKDRLFLIYTDPKQCGQVSVYPSIDTPKEFSYLGLDILDYSFTGRYLISESLKLLSLGKKKNLKSFLMDTSIIAWLDNEVASEAMFLANLNPMLDVTTELSSASAQRLAKILVNTYRGMLSHLTNDFMITERVPLTSLYSVYGHKTCMVCDSQIQKVNIEGKPTYWCPSCQGMNVNNGVVK